MQYREYGMTGFYNGLQASVLRAMILNATQLGTYDHIKHFLINTGLLGEGSAVHFASSIVAGVVMATSTSPPDLIKTRLMN